MAAKPIESIGRRVADSGRQRMSMRLWTMSAVTSTADIFLLSGPAAWCHQSRRRCLNKLSTTSST